MVEEDVENILREIRDRVRAQELAPDLHQDLPMPGLVNSTTGNGADTPTSSREVVENSTPESLARIDSYLATTARAWDRLPPLMSYRDGAIARFELWVKRQIKRATHWFTWEQVNFNAAVHHGLLDMLGAQRGIHQSVEKLRAEMKIQVDAQSAAQQALGETCAEIKVWVQGQSVAQAEYDRALEKLRAELKLQVESQSAAQAEYSRVLENVRAEMQTKVETQAVGTKKEIDALLAELAKELRERNDQIQEEQRVCFKQLSLESTEAAVLEDRSRRKAEKLLEELARRIKQLEKQS